MGEYGSAGWLSDPVISRDDKRFACDELKKKHNFEWDQKLLFPGSYHIVSRLSVISILVKQKVKSREIISLEHLQLISNVKQSCILEGSFKRAVRLFNLKPFSASSAPVFVRHQFLRTPFFPVWIVLVESPIIWIEAVTYC